MSSRLITNTDNNGPDDHLMELLAGETLGDLTTDERQELDAMAPGLSELDRTTMSHAAAALALMTPQNEPVPASLTARLLDDVRRSPLAFADSNAAESASDVSEAPPSLLALSGWLAAAAALVAAFVIAVNNPAPSTPLTTDQAYQAFLGEKPADTVEYEWTNVMVQGVTGKVYWSDDAQEGYMVFAGLAANDPTQEQYQLWIFDAQRPDATPVDGGVFDIAQTGDTTIVKIDAKVPVREVQWFAITVEEPGGVVVSERKSIPVVANMPA